MSSIEEIILDHDRRGVSALRKHLPADFCREAATLILDNPGHALICSGFHILTANAPETDGPPGAYFLGQALQSLGYQVTQVTDRYTSFLYQGLPEQVDLLEFPIMDVAASKRYADEVMDRLKPSVVISTERCGVTATGRYLNMHGVDISEFNAKVDYLVLGHPATVGVGDGGNEIGMGSLVEQIPAVPSLPSEPTTTAVTQLIIASVSNWGVYGLITALSQISKRNLLPSMEAEEELIKQMVDKGAVDGTITKPVYGVDGFTMEENLQALARLHALLVQEGLPAGG